jgi:DNA-binding transcriptional MerR regulator
MAAKKTTTTIRTSKMASSLPRRAPKIPDKVFFRIGEVARLLGVKTYVLRYWETEFPTLAPQKSASNQRVYRRADVETLLLIKHLLYEEKYSIEGARKRVKGMRTRGVETETEPQVTPGLRTDKLDQLREMTRELKKLAQTPISRLFHF